MAFNHFILFDIDYNKDYCYICDEYITTPKRHIKKKRHVKNYNSILTIIYNYVF
jgi:hypothetical protein